MCVAGEGEFRQDFCCCPRTWGLLGEGSRVKKAALEMQDPGAGGAGGGFRLARPEKYSGPGVWQQGLQTDIFTASVLGGGESMTIFNLHSVFI